MLVGAYKMDRLNSYIGTVMAYCIAALATILCLLLTALAVLITGGIGILIKTIVMKVIIR
jgi:hypothetical protein